jgi:hypothetical protein
MNRRFRKNGGDEWWYTLSILSLTIVSSIALFRATGIFPTTSAPFAGWVIFVLCVAALQKVYEVFFPLVAFIVDFKWRQLKRRRQAGRSA